MKWRLTRLPCAGVFPSRIRGIPSRREAPHGVPLSLLLLNNFARMSIIHATIVEVAGRLEVVGVNDQSKFVDFGNWQVPVALGHQNIKSQWFLHYLFERPLSRHAQCFHSIAGESAQRNVSQGGGALGDVSRSEATK